MSRRNENRPGYRKTKAGWIPEDWKNMRLSEAVSLAVGQILPMELPYCNHIHIGPENIESGTGQIIGPLKTALELGLTSGKYLFDENAIVYSKIRPNLNKVCFPRFVGICSADAYPIWAKEGICPKYLFHFMQSYLFVKQATACSMRTGLPKINRDELNTFLINLPPLPEQEKIAEILSAWDRAIERTRRLADVRQRLKKGLMQQLLTGRMRFPEFGKPGAGGSLPEGWKKVCLKNLAVSVKRKNTKNCQRVLTASGLCGLIDQKDFFNRFVAGSNLKTYYLLQNGEFAYNRSSMKGYPFGAIKRLTNYDEGVLSSLYICFAISEKSASSDFYAHYFESGHLNHALRGIVQVGARSHGLLNITGPDFFQLKVPCLKIKEQEKIAAALGACDREIQILRREEAALRLQKKGMMQKLLTGEVRVHARGEGRP